MTANRPLSSAVIKLLRGEIEIDYDSEWVDLIDLDRLEAYLFGGGGGVG